ncbi:Adenylate cyclase 2 [Rubripirellula amarantea]|uniref:Adenylate cyclase 2 n=1 Tax=Rubripirellula amarantea TaxID=2527999 RepID=A0A5C5WJ54_9BACT|nr:adenylate/guanylate cyclase domain-containing protein [Rubripirellula amarantea]TWT50670.1 Adenylate cyclase 2 [Rubripirellula amarantea]
MHRVKITVFSGSDQIWSGIARSPLDIGRQQENDAEPLTLHDSGKSCRLSIAPLSARSIPRSAIRVSKSPQGELVVTNIHRVLQFATGDGAPLDPGSSFSSDEEIIVSLPDELSVRVRKVGADSGLYPATTSVKHDLTKIPLESYFSDSIADALRSDQTLLDGKDANVTVVACQIRGLHEVAERVGAKRTIAWIQDVHGALGEVVLNSDGVLVDHSDECLTAMWGAPVESTDHATRACQSAIEMLAATEAVRERWQDVTPKSFATEFGLHSGYTRVGNLGSRLQFKYGPMGRTLEIAARLRGLSSTLRTPILISGATASAIENEHTIRRLRQLELDEDEVTIDVYELHQRSSSWFPKLREEFEAALEMYERDDFASASQRLAKLVIDFPDDYPSLALLRNSIERLTTQD